MHCLELRYSHVRIKSQAQVKRLADSISSHGQLEPLHAVVGQDILLILIDGYHRYAALQYLERDTAQVLILGCSEDQALFQLLLHRSERNWTAIEEAGIIQELYRRFGCTYQQIGSRIGRDKSFVKRRLDLLESLPEDILKHVLSGVLSTWSASRIMVPLARANPDDAVKLAAALELEPMPTRQLRAFYEHYQKSNRKIRQRMIAEPSLFMKSQQAIDSSMDTGPEEKWLCDAKAVCGILHRLQQNADTVFYPNQEKKQRHQLMAQAGRARRLTLELQTKIEERLHNDSPNQGRTDKGTEQTGNKPKVNCQTAGSLPHHSEQGAGQPGNKADPGQRIKV